MIFYAEDDTNIRELVLYTLQKSGFADGAALMQAMRAELPDLVLLDVMLPGEDGVSLLRRLRADGAHARSAHHAHHRARRGV